MRKVYIRSKRNIIIRCFFLIPFVPIVLIALGLVKLYEAYSEFMWNLLPNEIVKKTNLQVSCKTCKSYDHCVDARAEDEDVDLWCWNPNESNV